MSYMIIFSQEKHHFSLCSYFHTHPTTLLLKILGGPMHGPSPHLKFWGDRPPSPHRSPPLSRPTLDRETGRNPLEMRVVYLTTREDWRLQPVCPKDAERIRRGGAFAYDIVHMGPN